MFSQKMKTIGTVPKSNRKIVETELKWIPLTTQKIPVRTVPKSNRKIVETELKWIPLTTHSPELVHTLQ
jgi:hypothetical protein